jgi:hypothetical protein
MQPSSARRSGGGAHVYDPICGRRDSPATTHLADYPPLEHALDRFGRGPARHRCPTVGAHQLVGVDNLPPVFPPLATGDDFHGATGVHIRVARDTKEPHALLHG